LVKQDYKEETVTKRKNPDNLEEESATAPESARAETVVGPGPKISAVDRSVLPKDSPELTIQQMQDLRSKLKNKFH
jgi:hypothetical protein